jgi:hypothetical protein
LFGRAKALSSDEMARANLPTRQQKAPVKDEGFCFQLSAG